MKQLISMYAALEKYPVTVSYPNGKISKDSTFDELYDFNRDNDIIADYKFGPYTATHTKGARCGGHGEVVEFTKKDTDMFIPTTISKYAIGINKDFVILFKNIVAKSNGVPFENPFTKQIKENIYELMFYLRNVPDELMKSSQANELFNQLENIKTKMLATQNINNKKK